MGSLGKDKSFINATASFQLEIKKQDWKVTQENLLDYKRYRRLSTMIR
jgi:hypothetical protein